MLPIVYTKWGLANRFDDCIELNENLKKYPKLHAELLHHEIKHTNKKFTLFDLNHDLSSHHEINQRSLVMFMIRYPRTLIQFLPFYWSVKRKQFIYDLNLLLVYSLFFVIILTGTLFSLKFV